MPAAENWWRGDEGKGSAGGEALVQKFGSGYTLGKGVLAPAFLCQPMSVFGQCRCMHKARPTDAHGGPVTPSEESWQCHNSPFAAADEVSLNSQKLMHL